MAAPNLVALVRASQKIKESPVADEPKPSAESLAYDRETISNMLENNLQLIVQDARKRTSDEDKISKYFDSIMTMDREEQVKFIYEVGNEIRAQQFAEQGIVGQAKSLGVGAMQAFTGDSLPEIGATIATNLPPDLRPSGTKAEIRAGLTQDIQAANEANPISTGAGKVAAYAGSLAVLPELHAGKAIAAMGGGGRIASLIGGALSRSSVINYASQGALLEGSLSGLRAAFEGTADTISGRKTFYDAVTDIPEKALEGAKQGAVVGLVPVAGKSLGAIGKAGGSFIAQRALMVSSMAGSAGKVLRHVAPKSIDKAVGLVDKMKGSAKYLYSKTGEKAAFLSDAAEGYISAIKLNPEKIFVGSTASLLSETNKTNQNFYDSISSYRGDALDVSQSFKASLSGIGPEANKIIDAMDTLSAMDAQNSVRSVGNLKKNIASSNRYITKQYASDLSRINYGTAPVNLDIAIKKFKNRLISSGAISPDGSERLNSNFYNQAGSSDVLALWKMLGSGRNDGVALNPGDALKLINGISSSSNFANSASLPEKFLSEFHNDAIRALPNKKAVSVSNAFLKKRKTIDSLDDQLAMVEAKFIQKIEETASKSGFKFDQLFSVYDRLIDSETGRISQQPIPIKSKVMFASKIEKDIDSVFPEIVQSYALGIADNIQVIERVARNNNKAAQEIERAKIIADEMLNLK